MNSKDILDMLKWRYIKRVKEIEDMFDKLNINFDSLPEFRRLLRNSAYMLLRNGAINTNRISILSTCAKKMLEQTGEIDLSKKLNLMIVDLENLMFQSLSILRQLKNDIRHHKNTGMLLSQLDKDEKSELSKNVMLNSFKNDDDLCPHTKVLRLEKEINLKKAAIKRLRIDISEYEGLPPNIQLARKILEEAKLKAEMLNNEIELSSRDSFLDTSLFSFSP